MSDSNRNTGASGGICLPTALFLIFLTLKLCGVIQWSWLWVCSPLWIPFALLLVVFVGGLLAIAATGLFVKFMERKDAE